MSCTQTRTSFLFVTTNLHNDHFLLLLSAVHLAIDDPAWGGVGSPGTQTRETEQSECVDMCVRERASSYNLYLTHGKPEDCLGHLFTIRLCGVEAGTRWNSISAGLIFKDCSPSWSTRPCAPSQDSRTQTALEGSDLHPDQVVVLFFCLFFSFLMISCVFWLIHMYIFLLYGSVSCQCSSFCNFSQFKSLCLVKEKNLNRAYSCQVICS